MKRILYIAPHSFPVSSSESICNSKIAYTLAEMGYKVDVYSCTDSYNYPKNNELDMILGSHPNLNIHYVLKRKSISRGGALLHNIKSIFAHFIAFVSTGYFYNGSILPYDIIKAVERDNDNKLDFYVMITRGFLTDIAGIYIKKKYGIRWIANWNDPYTEEKFPPPYGKGPQAHLNVFKQKIYNDVQKYADLHTFPNPRLRDYMLRCFTNINIENTFVIPHMAMGKLLKKKSEILQPGKPLTIVHCGNVRYPRDPSAFVNALAIARNHNLFQPGDLIVKFVGLYDPKLPLQIKEQKLEDTIELHPPVSYNECLSMINESQISLIIEAVCEEGIYLPTKLVDAIQCGTPVLCVSPIPGVLQDLVSTYKIGYFADNTKVNSIVDTLKRVIDDYCNRRFPIIERESASIFFDDAIAKQYNEIL